MVLLVSCFDESGPHGGLYAYSGKDLERFDSLPSTALLSDAGSLIRGLAVPEGPDPFGEILAYDETGVSRYLRVPGLADIHDLAFDPPWIVAASSFCNALVWVDQGGQVVRTWQAPGEPDSWHLNGVCVHGGDLYATAFGRFTRFRDWDAVDHSGMLFHVHSGRDVVARLAAPHSPIFVGGEWLLCNAKTGELLAVAPRTGKITNSAHVGGWTRGIAVSDDFLFVASSAPRHQEALSSRLSTVAVLDRSTWQVLATVDVPAREVSSLALVTPELCEGARRGFNTNPMRLAGTQQDSWLQAPETAASEASLTSEPLARQACKVSVQAKIPATAGKGQLVDGACLVVNGGPVPLISAQPNPVSLSWRWRLLDRPSRQSAPLDSGTRIALPSPLPPGGTTELKFFARAPEDAGTYEMRLTLVQEHVHWFDDIDRANGCVAVVKVQ